MRRRTVLQRSIGITALAVTLAGCSGSDDDGDDENDGESGSENGGTEGDISGTAGSTPDGLEITNTSGRYETREDEQQLVIDVVVQNVGDRTTRPGKYRYGADVTTDQGEEVAGTGGAWTPGNLRRTEITPGESMTMEFEPVNSGWEGSVTSYTIRIDCTDFWNGVYCPQYEADGGM